jgi:hypothetical protein
LIKSLASKMRKALVAATSAAVALTGLTAMPASAGGPVYAAANAVFDQSWEQSVSLTSSREITVGEGVYTLNLNSSFSVGEAFFTANVGKTVSTNIQIIDTDGKTVSLTNGNGYTNNYINFCDSSFVVCDRTQAPDTNTVQVKAGHKYGSISIDGNYYAPSEPGAESPTAIKAGTYTWVLQVLVDGVLAPFVADTTQNGVVANNIRSRANSELNPTTVGADVDDVTGGIAACIDSTKISVGDVLTPTAYVNGSALTGGGVDFDFGYRGPSPSYRQSQNNAVTATVTQDDIDYGLSARSWFYGLSVDLALQPGDTVESKIAVVDQDGNDVTGDCAPGAPGKPTLALENSSLKATFATAKFADPYGHRCEFSLASTPNVIAYKNYSQSDPMNPNSPNRTCSYNSPISGESYVVRVYASFYQIKGAYSAFSESVKVPASGYTITAPVSGLTDGGKVSVHGAADTDAAASRIFAYADGKGGTYRLATFTTSVACPPCGPSDSTFKLRKSSASGLDASFGTNGVLDWDPSVSNSTNGFFAYYGAGASNFTLGTSGYNMQSNSMDFEFVQATSSSKTLPASTKVASSVFTSTCSAQGAGWGTKMFANSTSLNIYPISAPTAKQLFMLSCYKEVTLADNVSKAYLEAPILVTIDNATTVNVVKVLGEHSANVNQTIVRFSSNPTATGSAAALTLFVTKQAVAATMPSTSGTVYSREIVRIAPDLTASVTANAWTVSSNAISAQPSFLLPAVNDGTINGMFRFPIGPTFSLVKVGPTGTLTVGAEVLFDKAADFMGLNWIFPVGVQAGDATDLTVMATSMNKAAVASIKIATGTAVAGEQVSWTQSMGNGQTSAYVYDAASKDVYWWFNDAAAAAGKLSIYKWRDPLYVKPTGPVPAVTSKNLEYATNTPAAGTKVTFTGTNLNVATAVKFGTVAATLGTKTATSLEVTVPAGTGTVAITIESANGNGAGGNFTYVGANKVAQTVTLDAGANTAAMGDADRTLSATVAMTGYTAVASLTYSSTTAAVCTVTGNKLKFVAKGTCSVKATQAGSSWTAEGVATKDITVTGPDAQTITIKAPTTGEKLVGLDGYFIYPKTNSGLPLSIRFDTPTVCKKGTFAANHVINVKTGTCKITVLGAGSALWMAGSSVLTYTVGKAGTTSITDSGNASAPVVLNNSGTKTNVLSEVVSWKKSTGALTVSSRGVWVGPITATATFKIGSKSYSCTLKYGTLKAASATSVKGFPAGTALCGGKTTSDKAALAALKKIAAPVTVKIVVVRELRNPAKYTTKGQKITRSVYVTIG